MEALKQHLPQGVKEQLPGEVPKELFFGAYGVVLLGFWIKVGFSALLCVILLGTVPVILALAWYHEDLAPFTGLIDKDVADREKREARNAEKEVFRSLLNQEGGETMEWMNFLIAQMWPHIAKYAEGVIMGMEETIQKSVPVGIRFQTVSLGKEPIRFGPVTHRTTGCYYDDKFQEEGGVEFQIGLNYHSDCEIILATKFATVGAASLEIAGTLSVLFRPLLGEAPPFFGGIEVLFTNPPVVELDFKGIGNLADMPGIYGTVRRIIDDAIAGVMVMPNRIAQPMVESDKVDLARLKNPPPEGILRIKVVRAEKLAAMDYRMLGSNTSDPYVSIKVGRQFWKTPTIRKTCDPVWTEGNTHDFAVYSTEQSVFIDVFDWDHLSADDPLGSVMVHNHGVARRITAKELISLTQNGEKSFRLYAGSAKEDAPPEDSRLFLEVEWLWLMHPLDGPPLSSDGSSSNYVLTLKVDECKDMPDMDAGLRAPFTVRLSVLGSEDTKESGAGWSKWSNTMSLRTLEIIRKLHANKCSSDVIADTLDVEEDLIKEFLAKGEGTKDDQAWIDQMAASRTTRELTLNPQFEEVLLLTSPKKSLTAVVELLDDPSKRPKAKKGEADVGVVARFEVPLGTTEVVDGPFPLLDPKTKAQLGGKAALHGTFTLWRLEKATRNLKFKAVTHMIGMAGVAARRGQEAAALANAAAASSGSGSGAVPPMDSTHSEASFGSQTRVRKRDKFFAGMRQIFSHHREEPHAAAPAEPETATAARPPPTLQERGRSVAEEVVELVAGCNGKDVLFGLGLIRNARDWERALGLYKRHCGEQGSGKGRGDLVAALEKELPSAQDRQRAAQLLQVHGIGTGAWPPPRRCPADPAETASSFVGEACLGRRSCG